MIKTLRIRFIITTMILVLVILTALIGAINVINFKRITDNADDILEILSYNDGIFAPDFKPSPEGSKPNEENSSEASDDDEVTDSEQESSEAEDEEEEEIPPTPDHITIETPFETRYFSVKFSSLTPEADITHIATYDEPQAIAMAAEVLAGHDTKGYYGSYRFLVIREKSLVIFIDWTRQMETASNFLFASVLTALCVLVITFGIVLFLSLSDYILAHPVSFVKRFFEFFLNYLPFRKATGAWLVRPPYSVVLFFPLSDYSIPQTGEKSILFLKKIKVIFLTIPCKKKRLFKPFQC